MNRSWRLVDIVVVAVLGVAFGAVFQAWNTLWAAMQPAFLFLPPLQGVMYGVWMLPAVLAALLVQRPGAAVMAELIAALTEVLFGAPWGPQLIIYGLLQGAGAEVVFAATRYRTWRLPTAIGAGALAGLAAAALDIAFYYLDWPMTWKALYAALVTPSAALVAGIGSWLLVRALAQSGVLAAFPSGRWQRRV